MKICIINGSPRKGNTYKATQIFKARLENKEKIEFTEFFLPRDLPHFCCGCYNCFERSEDKCPHARYTLPMEQAMKEADAIIITSPVYVLAESGAVKAFLDHYGYMYLPHRPMEEMFSKVGMVISTTAGAGTALTIKTISKSLSYWGVKRVFKCGLRLLDKNWEDMKPKKQRKFEEKLFKKADKFYKAVREKDKLHTRIHTRFVFMMIKKMLSGCEDTHTDKKYWINKGWVNGQNKPF